MASGVKVSQDFLDKYDGVQKGKQYRYLLGKIDMEAGEVVATSTGQNDGDEAGYDAFLKELPKDSGMYAVYDFSYKTKEGQDRSKVVLITWAPEDSPIKERMLYASTKQEMKKKISGIQAEIQGTDLDEVSYAEVFEKLGGGTK
eukprot:m.331018 g.331018  ORF g.331018 m.331018 type:complete len:144 (-) comp16627_c0_seq1:132-563(-)